MMQVADRRQPGASSTPPSLPAPGWRRDLSQDTENIRRGQQVAVDPSGGSLPLRAPDRPALVMVVAPLLGAALWVAALSLLL